MDEHVRSEIAAGLRSRGIDLLTADEDGAAGLEDSDLLDRATQLGRALVTNDEDFLAEAAERWSKGVSFAGIFYAHQLGITIGQAVESLELACEVYEPAEIENRVVYLPI